MKASFSRVILICEGKTEMQFYKRWFRHFFGNLNLGYKPIDIEGGISEAKIVSKVKGYLESKRITGSVFLVVAIDREGGAHKPDPIEIADLRKQMASCTNVNEIEVCIATKTIESWFFHDFETIVSFLKIKESKTLKKKYNNPESIDHIDLSALFTKSGRFYIKGEENELVEIVDVDLIHSKVSELQALKKNVEAFVNKFPNPKR